MHNLDIKIRKNRNQEWDSLNDLVINIKIRNKIQLDCRWTSAETRLTFIERFKFKLRTV